MDAETLTDLLDATWPSASTRVERGWRIRHDPKGGNRVSATSALIPGKGDGPLDAPLYMVREGEQELDATLAVQGYTKAFPCHIMAIEAKALAQDLLRDRVIACEGVLAKAREIWAEGNIGPARIAIMERAQCPKTVLLGRADDRALGTTFVGIHGDQAMLHALFVHPSARRTGLARDITIAAARWTLDMGATTLTLIVEESNGPARALYEGLGMGTVARYHYRKRPGGTP